MQPDLRLPIPFLPLRRLPPPQPALIVTAVWQTVSLCAVSTTQTDPLAHSLSAVTGGHQTAPWQPHSSPKPVDLSSTHFFCASTLLFSSGVDVSFSYQVSVVHMEAHVCTTALCFLSVTVTHIFSCVCAASEPAHDSSHCVLLYESSLKMSKGLWLCDGELSTHGWREFIFYLQSFRASSDRLEPNVGKKRKKKSLIGFSAAGKR